MALGIFLSLCSAMTFALNAMFYHRAGRRNVDLVPLSAVISVVACLLALPFVKWGVVARGEVQRPGDLILTMVLVGTFNQFAMVAVARTMKMGHGAITWTISQSAMLMTFLFAVIYWGEQAATSQWVGVFVVVAALALLSTRRADSREISHAPFALWLMMAFLSFLLSGTTQVLALTPSKWADWSDNALLRVPLTNGTAAVIFLAATLLMRKRFTGPSIRLGIVMGILYFVAGNTIFKGADALAQVGLASLMYPIAIGGSVLLFSAYSKYVLKEHFSRRHWVGIAAGIAGIVLLSLKG